MGQAGLVCDALYAPEIVLELVKAYKDKELRVRSTLDIDMKTVINKLRNDTAWKERPHLILCGTGDINIVTAQVLERCQNLSVAIRPGPSSPHSGDLLGSREPPQPYTAAAFPNAGCLVVVKNPWWQDRLIIICGGIFGVGTVGVLWLLHKYLLGHGEKWGNNRYKPDVPGKVINAKAKRYDPERLRDILDMIPRHDIRNIEESDEPIIVIE